jgi:hypothetical protein
MGEPVTTGMMIGAASGALMNRKNPIQGAMLGGAMGAAGGSFYGGAAGAATPGTMEAFGAQTYPGTASFSDKFMAGARGLGSDISAANTWMNQNPITSQVGFKLAQEAMRGPDQVPMPGGMAVNRGQIQPMDYMSLLNPQQQTVIRPATPSLI